MAGLSDDLDVGAPESGAPGAGAASDTSPAMPRRRARPAGLDDDVDVGEQTVGYAREDVRRMQRRKAKTRVYMVLGALTAVGLVGGLFWVTSGGKRDTGPVSKVAQAQATTTEEATQAAGGMPVDSTITAPSLHVDSAVPIGAGPTSVRPINGVPAVPTQPAASSGGPSSGSGTIDLATAPLAPVAPITPRPRTVAGTMPTGVGLLPPAPSTSHATGVSGAGEIPALPAPTTHVDPLAPRGMGAVSTGPTGAPERLTITERMRRVKGSDFGKQDQTKSNEGVLARYASNRSALAPVNASASAPPGEMGVQQAGAPSASDGGADATTQQAIRVTPGMRVSATVVTEVPSATSGEPLEVVLDEPLRDRGRIVAPAGTHAFGTGALFDDGTSSPRLTIAFTLFVTPDGRELQMRGAAFSQEDHRMGLAVPLNRQLVRKGGKIATAIGLAAAATRFATGGKRDESGTAYTEGAGTQVKRDAYNQVMETTKAETGLNNPTAKVLLRLPEGEKLWIVFGLQGAAGNGG